MLVLYKWIPEITSWREALFSGHFGNVFFFLEFEVDVYFLLIGPVSSEFCFLQKYWSSLLI